MDTKLILENQLAILWALYGISETLGVHQKRDIRRELERCMEQTRQRIDSLAIHEI